MTSHQFSLGEFFSSIYLPFSLPLGFVNVAHLHIVLNRCVVNICVLSKLCLTFEWVKMQRRKIGLWAWRYDVEMDISQRKSSIFCPFLRVHRYLDGSFVRARTPSNTHEKKKPNEPCTLLNKWRQWTDSLNDKVTNTQSEKLKKKKKQRKEERERNATKTG